MNVTDKPSQEGGAIFLLCPGGGSRHKGVNRTADKMETAAGGDMLRILIVTTGKILTPSSGGELRTHHLARGLSRIGHEVDVVSFVVRNHPERQGQVSPRLAIHERHSLWLDLAAVADRLRLVPATEMPVWLAPLSREIGRLTRQKPYDIVQFEFPWFARLYRAAGRGRVIYSAHNVESDWWGEQLGRYPLAALFRCRLLAHELRAITDAAGVAVCSAGDQEWMQAQAQARKVPLPPVALVPNGFDAERIRKPDPALRMRLREQLGFKPEEKIALFLGSNAQPNREAAAAIMSAIAPACPEVRFVIAGKVGSGLAAAGIASVSVTGPVEDPLPYLQAADVALNPMLSGSGSNIKVAEYCAAGLPVITTPFGLRGFEELGPWLGVREIADFPGAIAEARWPNTIPEQTLSGFSWAQSARRLAGLYQAVLRGEEGGGRRIEE